MLEEEVFVRNIGLLNDTSVNIHIKERTNKHLFSSHMAPNISSMSATLLFASISLQWSKGLKPFHGRLFIIMTFKAGSGSTLP